MNKRPIVNITIEKLVDKIEISDTKQDITKIKDIVMSELTRALQMAQSLIDDFENEKKVPSQKVLAEMFFRDLHSLFPFGRIERCYMRETNRNIPEQPASNKKCFVPVSGSFLQRHPNATIHGAGNDHNRIDIDYKEDGCIEIRVIPINRTNKPSCCSEFHQRFLDSL